MLAGNAYLVQGSEAALPILITFLASEGVDISNSADAYVRQYTHFGIDEARELTARAYGKSIGDASRVFIVVFPTITNEAQNALLKTLEEPPSGALFFLLTPAPALLLPTLRSRTQMLDLRVDESGVVDARRFLRSKPRERLEMLKPLLEKNDDDRRDIGGILTFLSSLERMLSSMPESYEGVRAVYRARAFAGDKGSLLKPLLEQVALLVPVV